MLKTVEICATFNAVLDGIPTTQKRLKISQMSRG
jgi:hypothetical protein